MYPRGWYVDESMYSIDFHYCVENDDYVDAFRTAWIQTERDPPFQLEKPGTRGLCKAYWLNFDPQPSVTGRRTRCASTMLSSTSMWADLLVGVRSLRRSPLVRCDGDSDQAGG